MDKDDKEFCKGMIRQAMDGYRSYNKYNVPCHDERRLVWDSMEAVLDYMPVSTYRKYAMRQYCDTIMGRLLNL